jgi:penicillin-binding protein 2
MRRHPKELAATHRTLGRRALLLGGLQAGIVGALALRMRYLQVDQAAQYRMLAEENRVNIRLIPPDRGELFDRNGVVLAQNSPSYRIIIVREAAGDVEQVIARLSQLITLDPEDIDRAMTEMHRSAPFLPVTLTDQISWDDIARVSVNAPALPGITPEVGLTRFYPRQSDFAHVIGYVGPVSESDLSKIEEPDQVLRIPRFQIGKVGLEEKREDLLRGKAGAKRVEINATGRVMRELSRREGRPGTDLQLTVDAELQGYVQARLGSESASVVVIDCETGDLRAIASSPSFDPNLFVRGISSADYTALTSDPYRPLANKSVQGTYPPASTFKMVGAMAALEDDLLDPEDTVYCRGYLDISGRRFHCWKRSGHGAMDMQNAIKQSCDVYFYELGMKTGIDRISAMSNKFGLGIRHDLPMSAVAKGLTPTREWKERAHGRSWLIGDTVNASIGQGYVLSSPLQQAIMTARLATGRNVTPRLIKSIDGVEQPGGGGEGMGMNENNLRRMRRAMAAVSNERRGTGYGARIIEDAYRLAGKSGTAQVRSISMAERRTGILKGKELPWEQRDHALFVSYAPLENPQIAISVVVEHGGGGSKAAAPIARDVTLQALLGDTPPLAAYPAKDREKIKAQQERLRPLRPVTGPGGKDRA